MPARHSRPVRYLLDESAVPPRQQEVVTATDEALAFWLGGVYDPAMPDHREPALLTGTWAVIQHHAPADVLPAFIHYDRAERPPFETGGERYRQLGEAMDAAAYALGVAAGLPRWHLDHPDDPAYADPDDVATRRAEARTADELAAIREEDDG